MQRPISVFGILSLLLMLGGIAAAESYSGDGTYNVRAGDTITANNGYYLNFREIAPARNEPNVVNPPTLVMTFGDDKSGYSRSFSLFFDEPDSFSKPYKISTGTMGGQNVLELKVDSISGDTARITLSSISEKEEQPGISVPEEEKKPVPAEGKTYTGDGVYILGIGDSVVASNGVTLKVVGFLTTEVRWLGQRPAVEIAAYSKEGKQLAKTHLLSYKEFQVGAGEFSELGLSIQANDINIEKGETQLSVSSALKITLHEGWNLFSAPLRWQAGSDTCENAKCYGPGTNGLKVLESTCGDIDSLKIWHWDASQRKYIKSPPYAPLGYWIKVPAQCKITFGSETVSMDGLQLKAGWNQIGSPTKSVIDFKSIQGDCNVVSGLWRYLNEWKRYEKVSTLAPGEGYFVKVSSDCTLGESGPPAPPQ